MLPNQQEKTVWTPERITQEIAKHKWYHNIDLGQGITTPGLGFFPIWEMIRRTRAHINYKGARVIDIASWDGMWAFEAEALGASVVVASEVQFAAYSTFLLCREILNSRVIPYYNASVYQLYERLDDFLYESGAQSGGIESTHFDIAQNLGLLYHLRDPFYGMAQTRSVLKKGGIAIFETAVVLDDNDSYMLHNGYPNNKPRVYEDPSTWWAMTVPCFLEMITATFFRPMEETLETIFQIESGGRKIGRASVAAEAIGIDGLNSSFLGELLIPYRTPGLYLPPGRR